MKWEDIKTWREVAVHAMHSSIFNEKLCLSDLLIKSGIIESKSQARRLIQQNGIRFANIADGKGKPIIRFFNVEAGYTDNRLLSEKDLDSTDWYSEDWDAVVIGKGTSFLIFGPTLCSANGFRQQVFYQ